MANTIIFYCIFVCKRKILNDKFFRIKKGRRSNHEPTVKCSTSALPRVGAQLPPGSTQTAVEKNGSLPTKLVQPYSSRHTQN